MSDDQPTSIEENGDYWLSKSDNAYHIINPNATNLTIIEANGYYSLAKGGDTYYVLDANGNSTRLDDEDIANRIAPGNPTGPWSIIQVESTGPTMLGEKAMRYCGIVQVFSTNKIMVTLQVLTIYPVIRMLFGTHLWLILSHTFE